MPRRNWTAQRRHLFLQALRTHGHVADAAMAVGMSRSSALALRRRDKAFAEAWADAEAACLDDLRREVMRRARDGIEKPVFYGGKTVGSVRTPSDQLAMFLLRHGTEAARGGDDVASPLVRIEQRLKDIEANIGPNGDADN